MSKQEKITSSLIVAILMILFFTFGYYHLTKFETTDEHLWKYGRIKQYWQAVKTQDWKNTYINDKPGVTIALFSGAGLLFEPNPESHRINDPNITQNRLFKIYDIKKTDFINLIFRLPILILATLSIPLFFWLILKAFDSVWLALFSTIFIALNPILIGMTQIINPDSYFWMFGGLSAFSYLAHLNKKGKKFLILTCIFTGLALLSKYTAVMLFVFYGLALISKFIFSEKEIEKSDIKIFFKECLNIVFIFIIAAVIFSVFLPAVFVEPRYLTKGVGQFVKRGNIKEISIIATLLIGLMIFYRGKFLEKIFKILKEKKKLVLIIACTALSFVILSIVLNVFLDQKLVPFDEMRDTAYAKEPRKFNFGTLIKFDNVLLKNTKLLLFEFYPLVFSLTILNFALLLFLLGKSIFKKINIKYAGILVAIIIFTFIYYSSTILAGVVANVRYSIILQPLFSFLAAVAFLEFLKSLKLRDKRHLILSTVAILLISGYIVWSVKPFYFSYENPILPKKFTINSTWGSGFYEAAQYLNSKPDPEELIIWTNSTAVCHFFKGRCINKNKINLEIVKPDYFVISKRGAIKMRKRFIFVDENLSKKSSEYYFDNIDNNYEWKIDINQRPENYVKIVKNEE